MKYLYEFIEHQDDMPFRMFVNSVDHIQFHWHKEVEMICVLQGSVRIYVGQHNHEYHPGDFLFINSLSAHKIEKTGQDNVLLALQFSPELLERPMHIRCSSLDRGSDGKPAHDKLRHYLARMAWELNKKPPGYRSCAVGLLHMLIGHLVRSFPHEALPDGESGAEPGNDYELRRLNRVLQYIDKHYSQKITLQDIARQEHLSLHYFSHFFKDKIGIPFQKYLTLIRLEKSAELLAGTNKNVTQIASECGFANVKAFNTYFKEKYGTTPTGYRDKQGRDTLKKSSRWNVNTSAIHGAYYDIDTIQAMDSLYAYLERGYELPHNSPLASDSISIEIHADDPVHPYEPNWRMLTTAGRAIEGLRADWQEQFREMQARLRFRYIRFHGIFNDEMMIYNETEDGVPVYNWSYVDRLYDFLLSTGTRPFVELSFMPSLLRRSGETIFWWKGNISPPREMEKWTELVRQFVRHCVNRYGLEEVKQWYFEVWNEPDLEGICWAGTREEYFHFYHATAEAIKAVDSDLRTGGPALGYGSIWNDTWAEDFFNYCKTSQAPLDFFSFHVYSEYPFTKYEERLTTIMPPDFYARTIERIRGKLQAAQLPVMPELHVTEWNFSLYDRNYIHDTMFMAPFILRHALQSQGRLHSLGFWSFTDVFEESQAVPAILHGGFGLFNRNGLRKPAYYAFELLAKLTGHLLRQGEGYAIARSDDDYSILLYHYVHVDPLFASGDWSGLTERDRYTVFEEKGDLEVALHLDGLSGDYKATTYLLDRDHGSLFDEWARMGAPGTPSEEEIDYLRRRTGPAVTVELLEAVSSFDRRFVIPPHGVQLVTLRRQY